MIRLVVVFPLRCGCTVNPLTIAVIFGQLTGPGEPGLPVRMVWILLLLCSVAFAYTPEEPLLFDSFPDDFLWGYATAAYQVILTSSETIHCKYNSIRLRAPGTRMEKGRAFGTFSPRYLITPFSQPRCRVTSSTGPAEMLLATATTTTRRMCVS